MTRPVELPEIGEDALDQPIEAVQPARGWLPRRRPALGLQPTPAPTLLFVLIGVALGPVGLNLLSATALFQTQAIVWVALAVIGVFVGLGLAERPSDLTGRAYRDGAIIATISIPVVSAGLYLLLTQSQVPVAGALAGSCLIGLCASVSAAVHVSDEDSAETRHAAYLADLDDLPLLVIGIAVVAALAGDNVLVRLAVTAAAGLAIGVTGILLFERSDGSERGLFVTGTVLLLAGVGAYLGTSPLLSGAVAAVVWAKLPGRADRISASDLRLLQHPLVALLLVIAGAAVEWSLAVLWVTVCTIILRLAAKLLASLVISRLSCMSPGLLATVLLQPGVLGVALALNAGQLLGPDARWIVSAVTISAVASEVLGSFLAHSYQDAA
ncbi:MAG: hypothetical protein AB7N65_13890 [Vicinamibacterales bacterium]